MTFHNPQNKTYFCPEIKMNGSNIDHVNSFKFLGITIDNNLNWKTHINDIRRKCLSAIGILARLKNMLPAHAKLKIYHSLIACHLNYGILLWGHRLNDIFPLQKRAMRLILNRKYNAHADPLFKILKILRLSDMYTWAKIKFYYKYHHKSLPNYLLSLSISRNNDIPNYPRTRGSTNIHKFHCHKFAIRKTISDCINSLTGDYQTIKDKLLHDTYKYGLTHLHGIFKQLTLEKYSADERCNKINCYSCNHT